MRCNIICNSGEKAVSSKISASEGFSFLFVIEPK
jgi:hypothetical protein